MTNTTIAAPPPVAPDIRDIKPPLEIGNPWAWLWWIAAGLAVAIVAYVIWKMLSKRQARQAEPPPVPAHVRAKQRLQEALALIAQPKPFVIAVSDAARHYLEERFNFHAPERTTEEFLYELQRTQLLTRDQKESLSEFLQQCDLVKFAKYEPREAELRALHGSALRLIEETEPLSHESTGSGESASDDQPPAESQTSDSEQENEIVNRKS